MTNCPNCGYPTPRDSAGNKVYFKGIYTLGKPCSFCGITAVIADANTCTLTMPTYEVAMQNAALAALRENLHTATFAMSEIRDPIPRRNRPGCRLPALAGNQGVMDPLATSHGARKHLVETIIFLGDRGLARTYKTPDGPLTIDLMVIAYDAFLVSWETNRRGLTSLELAQILGIRDPGHANRRWRPGSDRRVNEILKKFKTKGLIEYRKFPDGVWRWRLKEDR